MIIRDERPADIPAISDLVTKAFRSAPHRSGTEAAIVAALRSAAALTLSLVAVEEDAIIAHAAFSPVTIDGQDAGWFGLGPIAVDPDRQRRGVGARLLHSGLDRLQGMGASGVVVLGEPAYYARFGFRVHDGLRLPGVPAEYFMGLVFGRTVPVGIVAYHPAFAVEG